MQLEIIKWADHFSSQGWQEYPQSPPEDMIATTVGYLIYEDDTYVSLAHTVAEHACADVMYILKTDIKERKQINEGKGPGKATKKAPK